ncbi:MAG TPA: adenylate kinase [Firmicutes bacterium]|nr:adenylate kinase [Bacillota bacterium]
MRLVLLGIPGAGKGTQAALLAERYGIPAISTGAILREAIRAGLPVGERARRYINLGQLVPDEVMTEIVRVRLSEADCRQGFLLDGFPRTLPQARMLSRLLERLGQALDAAIDIRVSPGVAVERIAGRLVCQKCGLSVQRRELGIPNEPGAGEGGVLSCPRCGGELGRRTDDTVATARERIAVYLVQTRPVSEYYRRLGLLEEVDGELEIPQTFAAIVGRLEERKRRAGWLGATAQG